MATLRKSAGGPGSRGNRVLKIALAVSLAAHVLAFAVFPDLRESAGRQLAALPPLVARLVSPAAAPPPLAPPGPPAAVAPSPPAPARAAPHARTPRPIRPAPPRPAESAPPIAAVAPIEPPAPLEKAALAPDVAAAPAQAPRTPAPARVVAPSAPVATSARTPSQAAAPTTGADPATLEQYRLAIIVAGARFKSYPQVALDNNWTGTARVRLVVGAGGETVSLAVASASGHAVLDRAALEMVGRGKPQVPVPERLRGQRFTVEIPLRFELN